MEIFVSPCEEGASYTVTDGASIQTWEEGASHIVEGGDIRTAMGKGAVIQSKEDGFSQTTMVSLRQTCNRVTSFSIHLFYLPTNKS